MRRPLSFVGALLAILAASLWAQHSQAPAVQPAFQSCGTTSTCSATAIAAPRIVYGSVALVSGVPSTVTITGISPAFTSSSSYACVLTGATLATDNLLKAVNVSGSSFTVTGPASVADVVNYHCIGN